MAGDRIASSYLRQRGLRANGKLLLTAEYAVLDGALALALPTRLGQTLQVGSDEEPGILVWKSRDHQGKPWFEARFSLPEMRCLDTSDKEMAGKLSRILEAAGAPRLDPSLGYGFSSRLEFPRNWGLGSSSTLISLIARVFQCDPYPLLEASFGGSGYDLACAAAPGPILYQRVNGMPNAVDVPFRPEFLSCLYFVWLKQKQDTRQGIARYRERSARQPELVRQFSQLTMQCLCASELKAFEQALEAHENLVSRLVDLPKAKDLHFSDFWGVVKSLGAWGGDFALVSSARGPDETRAYFENRGYDTFFPYAELIL